MRDLNISASFHSNSCILDTAFALLEPIYIVTPSSSLSALAAGLNSPAAGFSGTEAVADGAANFLLAVIPSPMLSPPAPFAGPTPRGVGRDEGWENLQSAACQCRSYNQLTPSTAFAKVACLGWRLEVAQGAVEGERWRFVIARGVLLAGGGGCALGERGRRDQVALRVLVTELARRVGAVLELAYNARRAGRCTMDSSWADVTLDAFGIFAVLAGLAHLLAQNHARLFICRRRRVAVDAARVGTAYSELAERRGGRFVGNRPNIGLGRG